MTYLKKPEKDPKEKSEIIEEPDLRPVRGAANQFEFELSSQKAGSGLMMRLCAYSCKCKH